MTRRTALALCCTGILSVAVAADEPKAPACCAKKGAKHAAEHKGKMRCSLTGKEVDKCCCVQRDGKLHCTLAKKDVEKCCCVEAGGVKGEAKPTAS